VKLWLDDERKVPNESWTRATTMAEAVHLAERNVIVEMSLDHDLGVAPMCEECRERLDNDDPSSPDEDPIECRCSCHRELAKTGYDFVRWLVETGKWSTTKPRVHSQNPVGRANMQALIDKFWFNPQLN
jgi:hypothetical protein